MEKNKINWHQSIWSLYRQSKIGRFCQIFLAFLENTKFKENISPQNSKIQITSQFSKAPDPHRVGPASMLWRQDTMNDDSMQMDFIK